MCIEEPALEQVKLPLDVGTIVDTLWRDDKFYAARVIERRQMDAREDFQYYVHFLKCEAHMSHSVALKVYSLQLWRVF